MSLRRILLTWGALLALAIGIGAGTAFASHRWHCWRYADTSINWYNGASGTYRYIFEEEAITDADSWHNYTLIDLTPVSSSGSTDHINAYNGYYGTVGWYGIAEVVNNNGCTVLEGRARLNQSYLDAFTRTTREHVACQEVGHLFGLDHPNPSTFTSCMSNPQVNGQWYLNAPQPDEHDSAMIDEIY